MDNTFTCPVCKATGPGPFCPANASHSSRMSTGGRPDPQGQVVAKCVEWTDDKGTKCGALITGTRLEIGAWGTRCEGHRKDSSVPVCFHGNTDCAFC